MSKNMRVAG